MRRSPIKNIQIPAWCKIQDNKEHTDRCCNCKRIFNNHLKGKEYVTTKRMFQTGDGKHLHSLCNNCKQSQEDKKP